MGIVILRISEGAPVQLDDPGAGVRIGHGLFEEAFIPFGRAPPFHPVRTAAPLAEEREVGRGDRAKV
jgi:hypothetical protein